jgi:hypothetical protein
VPVIKAWEATMVARIEIINAGQYIPGGTALKKGLEYALGLLLIYAAWPMYASSREG